MQGLSLRLDGLALYRCWGSSRVHGFKAVNKVVPADDLQEVAVQWARRLGGPTTALSLITRMLDASGSVTFGQALEAARAVHIAYTTSDLREGMTAFLERREPRFTGT